jgi:hypothetical protein
VGVNPRTPEELRELFIGCAEVVRVHGKDSVPMSALAVSFGLVWHALSETEAGEFFDDLASWYQGDSETGAVRMPTEPPRRRRRKRRSWF